MGEKPLMVTIKLELDKGVELRWLAKDKVLGKEYKPKVDAVNVAGVGKVAVPADANITCATVPGKTGGDFKMTVMGFFNVPPTDPAHGKLKGKKNLACELELSFRDKGGKTASAGSDYQIVSAGKPVLSAMG
jgi:hypothetical protein